MALFKCKMCGGTLEVNNNETVAECEYCGTQQTLPRLDDDKRANMYDRANHFRRNNQYDKAMGIYEQILNEDKTDAEAYWSLVLCRYGIEYVEDPATHKRVPTVNRTQFTSIFDDDNYKSALRYADAYQKTLYEEEARAINEIQKGILAISQQEEPFDVFICYKESDNNGRRTPDSVLANDLYHQLTQEGFKVFFARITLEDKLGSAYEPYIFAALNSAKVMVVLGTKPEYFNAVWVKNEWSRYLSLVKNSGGKKILIPAYKDMDPYDLPEEFSHLQAQDMSKLGFMQDLIRGIKKLAQPEEAPVTVIKETVASGNQAVEPLLKRAFMFLEDRDWKSADEYCEKVLDMDPENAEAYVGKLMAELHVRKQEILKGQEKPFDHSNNYKKAIRFADKELKGVLSGYIDYINERNRLHIYEGAVMILNSDTGEFNYKEAAKSFESIIDYKDAKELSEKCYEKAETVRKDKILADGKSNMTGGEIQNYESAIKLFGSISGWKNADELTEQCKNKIQEINEEKRKDEILDKGKSLMLSSYISNQESAIQRFESISGWRDADECIEKCKKRIEELKEKEESEQKEREQKRVEEEKRKKRNKKIGIISTFIICVCAVVGYLMVTVVIPDKKYNEAMALVETKNFTEAYEIFCELEDYEDSSEKADSIYSKYITEQIDEAKSGETILLGTYEQDNDSSNGKEAIEWLILKREEERALLISKYGLDLKPYNTTYTDVTWETCSLRKWLNDSFVKEAFSEKERELILTTTVSADRNSSYITSPGKETEDQIFLLSIVEAEQYFDSDSARCCEATDYAVAKGVWTNSDNGNCWWWLRSPGDYQNYAASVDSDGAVNEGGIGVYYFNNAVRPALWVSLDS